MPSLAGISVFVAGRHSVGMSLLSDDDGGRIVALRVRVDGEPLGVTHGDWDGEDKEGMEQAARAFIKAQGVTLQDS